MGNQNSRQPLDSQLIKDLDRRIEEALKAYLASGVEDQVDYQTFYLYSVVTYSTAIEGSTVTEIENPLLFDEDIAAKGRSLTEQMSFMFQNPRPNVQPENLEA